LSINTVALQKK